MAFLPIVERELRVRARSRAAYWSRFAVALVGAMVCMPQLVWMGPFGTPATMGRALFSGIVSAAFLISCGGCLFTADIISSERREGTLGLLLLTPVKVFDVLVGKLVSAGLPSLCALVACLPMLMIPLLAGGVTGGEVFRKGLVLVDLLSIALAAGLWASARGHEWLKTTRTALLLIAALVMVPAMVGKAFGLLGGTVTGIGLLSPLGTMSAAGDASYKSAAGEYWISLVLVQAVGWVLLISAGSRLRSGWREERGEIASAGPASVEKAEVEATLPTRRRLGDGNPLAWLLHRQRGVRALLWAGALVGLSSQGMFTVVYRFLSPGSYPSVSWSLSLASAALEGALFAWAASRFFVEARRTGELELLLTTPCGARELVSTQWAVLKRLLRWPMLVMLAPTLLRAVFMIARFGVSSSSGPDGSIVLNYAISFLLGLVDIILGVGALCWLGLWFGLKAGGQGRAIVWTTSLAKGLPFLITILCWFPLTALSHLAFGRWSSLYSITMWLPQVVNLALYLGLIRLARQHLLGDLAGAEPMKFDLRQSILCTARDAVTAFRKARHWTPS